MIPKISGKNEGTAYPFWVIIDPRQNFKTNDDGLHYVAGMFTGVWFSRESAQNFLDRTRYNFSANAHVFCMSGTYSEDWRELYNQIGEKPHD